VGCMVFSKGQYDVNMMTILHRYESW
jgi:hypothetical protein